MEEVHIGDKTKRSLESELISMLLPSLHTHTFMTQSRKRAKRYNYTRFVPHVFDEV